MLAKHPLFDLSNPTKISRDPVERPSELGAQPSRGVDPPPLLREVERCREKGCIFPATPRGTGKCLLHLHEQCEPVLFVSCQPTLVLLDRAKFGVPDPERSYRLRDRRRFTKLREEFLEDAA